MKILWVLYLLWIPNFYLIGKDFRTAQETLYQLFAITLFFISLFITKRIVKLTWVSLWLGIFGLWTMFLYVSMNMQIGFNFVFNIFSALLIYFIFLSTFKLKDTRLLFNCILGVFFINTVYLIAQMYGWDICGFVDSGNHTLSPVPSGLLALPAHYGIYVAIAIMVLASRMPFTACLLFGFIAVSKSTGALLAAVCGYLYILWVRRHEIKFWIPLVWFKKQKWFFEIRRLYIPLVFLMVIGLSSVSWFYIAKVDAPMGMFRTRPKAWKVMISDAMRKPLIGWGLDALRRGNMIYVKDTVLDNTLHAIRVDDKTFQISEAEIKKYKIPKEAKYDVWDNPHNEYINLLFHFSIIGVIIIGFVLFNLFKRLKRVKMTPELASIVAIGIVFLVSSLVQFPFSVARLGHLVPIVLGLYMLQTEE